MPGRGRFQGREPTLAVRIALVSKVTGVRHPAINRKERTVTGPGSWQPDPEGRFEYRWWDGRSWTDQVSHQGRPGTAPMGGAAQQAQPEQQATPQPAARIDLATELLNVERDFTLKFFDALAPLGEEPDGREALGVLPVPLADGRVVRGARGADRRAEGQCGNAARADSFDCGF